MIKIGIISDLHYWHWQQHHNLGDPVESIRKSIAKNKPNLILDAGDYEKQLDWGVPTYSIPGNHDYYGKPWLGDEGSTNFAEFSGIKIAMATLWTDLNNGDLCTRGVYQRTLADCHAITGFTPDIMYEVNQKHQDFLRQHKGADIVVTHHCPSFRSVHERYKIGLTEHSVEYKINFGFASHLDSLVQEINPKFWIHGHTHDEYDYNIGNTRVICHPCGYPSEAYSIRGSKPYEPQYIKI